MDESPHASILQRRDAAASLLATLERDFAAVVTASGDSNADDEHDPEGATIAFERAQLDASIADLRRQVTELDAAMARVDAGTYGICAVCGMPIPDARLEVRPSATTCVQHAPR
jgi:RNA polymerase-binding transcription factor DksA